MSREDPSPEGHRSIPALLERHGLRARRSLGQNFLADSGLCRKISDLAAEAGQSGGVLEIGAGLGALTGQLLERFERVVAIETDGSLCEVLRDRFESELGTGRLELIEGDVREQDLHARLSALPEPRVLCGNLPYNLSGLLLRQASELSQLLSRCVFLLQLEVVDRLCAAPASSAYGALSVFTQAVYQARRGFVVRRGAFYPQPNVDSASVVLSPWDPPRPAPSDDFTRLVRAAFQRRRKTLRNAWRPLDVDGTPVVELVAGAGIDLGRRGETLSVEEFERVASALARARAAVASDV